MKHFVIWALPYGVGLVLILFIGGGSVSLLLHPRHYYDAYTLDDYWRDAQCHALLGARIHRHLNDWHDCFSRDYRP